MVLPITFVNTGFNEVYVHNLALRIIDEKSSEIKLYIPLFELDMNKFTSGKKRLTVDNMDTPFTSFAIPTTQTKMKHIIFSQVLKDKNFPHNLWKAGNYRFELYTRTKINKKFEKLGKFVFKIDKKMIDDFNAGNSNYLLRPFNFEVNN